MVQRACSSILPIRSGSIFQRGRVLYMPVATRAGEFF